MRAKRAYATHKSICKLFLPNDQRAKKKKSGKPTGKKKRESDETDFVKVSSALRLSCSSWYGGLRHEGVERVCGWDAYLFAALEAFEEGTVVGEDVDGFWLGWFRER